MRDVQIVNATHAAHSLPPPFFCTTQHPNPPLPLPLIFPLIFPVIDQPLDLHAHHQPLTTNNKQLVAIKNKCPLRLGILFLTILPITCQSTTQPLSRHIPTTMDHPRCRGCTLTQNQSMRSLLLRVTPRMISFSSSRRGREGCFSLVPMLLSCRKPAVFLQGRN